MAEDSPMLIAARRLALVTLLASLAACDTGKFGPAEAAPTKATPPPAKTAEERQAELLAKAGEAVKAGQVEQAIDAYLNARKVLPLRPTDAAAFASALKQNGDRLVAAGDELDRGMRNHAMALTVTPADATLASALVESAAKQEAAGGVFPEDILGEYVDQSAAELSPEAKSALAGAFKALADKLLAMKWKSARAIACLERAAALASDLPGLAEARRNADAKLAEEEAAATKIKAEVDAELDKHPDKDGVATIAKRRKTTREDVSAAIDVAAAVEEKRAAAYATECGRKPSCGGVDGGCAGDESVFTEDVEVSNCSQPSLVADRCWVTTCDVFVERSGAGARFELEYRATDGVPMPTSATRVEG